MADNKFQIIENGKIGENHINQIVTLLSEKIDAYLIYIFGSSANGNMREDSDLDVAF